MELQTEQDFEYDEAMSMESDEAFETADESDEGLDESDGEDYELATESDESDESDEADLEAVMEAEADGATRGDVLRQRRWAGALASDRKREEQRAAAVRSDITRQIRAIPTPQPARTYTVSPLRGASKVRATLANGHSTDMVLSPQLTPLTELNKLRAIINVNDRRQGAALAANTRAINGLARAQAAAVKKLADQQVKSDKELAKRIVEGDTAISKRLTAELSGSKGGLAKQQKRIFRLLRQERRRRLFDNILLTTAMPIFAAYGDRSSPISKTNLILTGSLAGWLLGDELLDQYMSGPGKAGRTVNNLANVWSYVAPVGNAATAYLALRNVQHERFVTGVAATTADIAANATGTVTVTTPAQLGIKDTTFAELKAKPAGTTVAVASMVTGGAASVEAQVVNGVLTLTVTAGATAIPNGSKIAWMVDTRPLAG